MTENNNLKATEQQKDQFESDLNTEDQNNATCCIAHVCLNSKLPKKHKDYCNGGFVDIAPSHKTCSLQCWKYCPECEAKGFLVIKKYLKNPERIKQGKNFGFKSKQNIQSQ